MPQISRRVLKPKVEKRVRELLKECVKRCQEENITENFIEVLLTKTEKLMLAKRIAIALMILKGRKIDEITEILRVTKTTVYTVGAWLEYKGNEYVKLLSKIADEDEERASRFDELENEAYGYQPRYGTNWKEARRRKWEEVKQQSPHPF